MLVCLWLVSSLLDLPILYPSGGQARFVGIHYLYPLIGVALLGLVTFVAGKRETALRFLVALPCYVAVLFAHFNFKLWIPHINPASFDALYWEIDQLSRPVIDGCMAIRHSLAAFIPFEANFYMISYIALFYCSFGYHAIKTPALFGKLVTATLLLQALGTFAYLVAPAIGPFIYEPGVDPIISQGQHGMLDFHDSSLSGGPQWLAEHGGMNFTAGLAAMPSLHTAGAFLYLLFAWKHGKALLSLYSLILFFILVTSIASRWHYLIDLPVGMAIAWASYVLAERLAPSPGKARKRSPPPGPSQPERFWPNGGRPGRSKRPEPVVIAPQIASRAPGS